MKIRKSLLLEARLQLSCAAQTIHKIRELEVHTQIYTSAKTQLGDVWAVSTPTTPTSGRERLALSSDTVSGFSLPVHRFPPAPLWGAPHPSSQALGQNQGGGHQV